MSPRTKEQCEEIREKRTQQILAAAEQVYLEAGTSLDIRDVAKQAKLGYGTVYHYYSNKHLLLADLLKKGFELAAAMTQAVFSGSERPLQQLERYCNRLPVLWREQPAAFFVFKLAAENFAGLEPEARGHSRQQFQESLYQPVVQCLRAAVACSDVPHRLDVEKTANTMIGAFIGCYGIYMYHGNHSLDPAFLTNVLLKGIREE